MTRKPTKARETSGRRPPSPPTPRNVPYSSRGRTLALVTRDEAKLIGRNFVGRWRVHVKDVRHGLVHVSASERARLRRRAGRSVKTDIRVGNRCLRAYPPVDKKSKTEKPGRDNMLSTLPEAVTGIIASFVGSDNTPYEVRRGLDTLHSHRLNYEIEKEEFDLEMKDFRRWIEKGFETTGKKDQDDWRTEYLRQLLYAATTYGKMQSEQKRFNSQLERLKGKLSGDQIKLIKPLILPETELPKVPRYLPVPLKRFWEEDIYDYTSEYFDRKHHIPTEEEVTRATEGWG